MPQLRFVLPGANENRWSDLLACLIETDPEPIARFVGDQPSRVDREKDIRGTVGRRSDRLDLLLWRGDEHLAAIEVKLLSDLGPDQLVRYQSAFPEARSHHVLHLGRLPVNLRATPAWSSIAWEDVLAAYAESTDPWASATARAWLAQLEALVPKVDDDTIWNAVPDAAADFELALRARVSWLAARMDAWCDLPHDTAQSSGGGNWAVRMWTDSASPGHFVTGEVQEGMTAYEWRYDSSLPYRDRVRGPVVLVGLRQDGTSTSADFDWPLLHRMFREHVLDAAGAPHDGRNWRRTSARPGDPTDKENWQAMVHSGAPPWLGQGWGMKVARSTQSCLFGARFALPADATLHEIEMELRQLQSLIHDMSATR